MIQAPYMDLFLCANGINLIVAIHVGTEDHPLTIRCERDVRFQSIVVAAHVDNLLRIQRPGGDQIGSVVRVNARHVGDRPWA